MWLILAKPSPASTRAGGGRIEIKLRHRGRARLCPDRALHQRRRCLRRGSHRHRLRRHAQDHRRRRGAPRHLRRRRPRRPVQGRHPHRGPRAPALVMEIWRKGKRSCRPCTSRRWSRCTPASTCARQRRRRDAGVLPPARERHERRLPARLQRGRGKGRGWHAEMFKRLWQSGSKARFRGDVAGRYWRHKRLSLPRRCGLRLHTAPHLKNYVNGLSGEKIMMAHSWATWSSHRPSPTTA